MDGCVFIALIASVAASLWQGQYTIDHVHWGLMLSNAKDLVEGRTPYRDIFIQYGFLTTLVHGIAFNLFGENLRALIGVTAIAYALGLWALFAIAKSVTRDATLSLCIFLTAALLHPMTIYPWSNYLAFPLLMLGLWGTLTANPRGVALLLTGLSLGLAVLMREGLAPAVVLFIAGSTLVDLLTPGRSKRECVRRATLLITGAAIPILIFFLYLVRIDAVSYWIGLSWKLPKVYIETYFPHFAGLGIAKPLLRQIANGVLRLDVRWILIAAMLVANAVVLILFLIRWRAQTIPATSAKLAIFSLLLVSSALHLPELFRIATGSVAGLVNLYLLLKLIKVEKIAFVGLAAAMLVTIAPVDSGEDFSTTNYFFPSREIIRRAGEVTEPKFFRGQRWDEEARSFYANIEHDLADIARRCDLHFHYNYTYDTFLQILSPFAQYQLAPFFTETQMSALRKDLDRDAKIREHKDLVIFQQTPNSSVSSFVAPTGFSVYKHYKTPRTNFLYRDNALLILVPTDCFSALSK